MPKEPPTSLQITRTLRLGQVEVARRTCPASCAAPGRVVHGERLVAPGSSRRSGSAAPASRRCGARSRRSPRPPRRRSAKASSTPPVSSSRVKHRLSPSSGWISGVAGSSAVSVSSTAGSASHSTSSERERVLGLGARLGDDRHHRLALPAGAVDRERRTAARDLMPARCAEHGHPGLADLGRSRAPVDHRDHAGQRAAPRRRSMRVMRMCATGQRQNTTCARRGSSMSSTNWPRPCVSRRTPSRGTDDADVALVVGDRPCSRRRRSRRVRG